MDERDYADLGALHDMEGDTEFATVATGGSIEEARRKALEQLRKLVPSVTDTDIECVVVDETVRTGFLGRGRTLVQVEARVRPSAPAPLATSESDDVEHAAEDLRTFLERVVHLMDLTAEVTVTETSEALLAEIGGDDLGLLIGRHGQTIDALQYLAAIVVNRGRRARQQVVVDAEGYRARRALSLHTLADRMAQKAIRERTAVVLKPMSAAERKVVHLHLKDHPRVETVSEGQEPHRAVVITPRRRG